MRKKISLLLMIVLTISLLSACRTSNSSVSLDSDDTTVESSTEVIAEDVISEDNGTVAEKLENIAEQTADTLDETTNKIEITSSEEVGNNADKVVEEDIQTETPETTEVAESDDSDDVMGVATVEITDVNETVWANRNCNIRSGYSTDTEKVGSLNYADSITRTGICSNGWSRVDYNGSVAYISSSLLSTEKIEKPTTVQVEVPVNVDAFALEVLNLVNTYRAENGLGALTWSQGLADAAAIRSAEAAVCWSHTRPDGSAWSTVSNLTHGENLGRGYNTPQDVVNAWKASPSHNANLLESRFKTLGVAYTVNERGYVWAQEFGY